MGAVCLLCQVGFFLYYRSQIAVDVAQRQNILQLFNIFNQSPDIALDFLCFIESQEGLNFFTVLMTLKERLQHQQYASAR